jgi:hypothetical protein
MVTLHTPCKNNLQDASLRESLDWNQAPEEKIPPCSSRPLAVECPVRAPFATCGKNIKPSPALRAMATN